MRDYLLHVRRSLLDAQPADPPRPRAEPRIFNGPKPRHARPASGRPDWVLLEVRRLRETEGMMPRNITARLAGMGVDLAKHEVTSILEYRTRAHLVPERGRREPYNPAN